MKYLESFELLCEYRNIEPFKLEFLSGLNIIVGENGSGKSSILDLMSKKEEKICKTKLVTKDSTSFIFLDTEKQNPRLKHSEPKNGDDIYYSLAIRFSSHGETMMPIIKHIEKVYNSIVFIDEPESGISLTNQRRLLKSFEKAISNGCQLVITTHSYVFIKNVKEVFNLDSKKWTSSERYLDFLGV